MANTPDDLIAELIEGRFVGTDWTDIWLAYLTHGMAELFYLPDAIYTEVGFWVFTYE